MNTHDSRVDEGFSLIEALVATGMLAATLLTLSHLLAMTVAANASVGSATYATALAAQKIETLQATTWEGLDAGAGTATESLDRAGGVVDGGSTPAVYTRQASVAASPVDPAGTRVLAVTVRVGRAERRLVAVRTRIDP